MRLLEAQLELFGLTVDDADASVVTHRQQSRLLGEQLEVPHLAVVTRFVSRQPLGVAQLQICVTVSHGKSRMRQWRHCSRHHNIPK